ncbi:UNVERIFIED_ORG: hypothetical protein J2Y81_008134 [Paraburkholderia sediminicola]|nr:hypothetical protein [Paraburkholderia sediminicola]
MPEQPVVTAVTVLEDLKALTAKVARIIVPTASDPIVQAGDTISLLVRKAIEDGQPNGWRAGPGAKPIADRLLWFAEALLSAKTVEGFMGSASMEGHRIPDKEGERVFVELLTATWLGLYFLGISVPDLWDRVRSWEDEDGGGLPNGVCVAKAIGDIVREARKARQQGPAARLCVHSFLPLLMFSGLIETGAVYAGHHGRSPERHDHVHALGRYYEFLQLQLYARAERPLLYTVPFTLFRGAMADGGEGFDHRRARWAEMWRCLRKIAFSGVSSVQLAKWDQRVILTVPSSPPACFLNHDTGLITFEGLDPADGGRDIPLPANYMRRARLRLYRERLVAFESAPGNLNLLFDDDEEKMFEQLYDASGKEKQPPVPDQQARQSDPAEPPANG